MKKARKNYTYTPLPEYSTLDHMVASIGAAEDEIKRAIVQLEKEGRLKMYEGRIYFGRETPAYSKVKRGK